MGGRRVAGASGLALTGPALLLACVGPAPPPPGAVGSSVSGDTTTRGTTTTTTGADDDTTTVSASGPNSTSTGTEPASTDSSTTAASSESTTGFNCEDAVAFDVMLFVEEATLVEPPMLTTMPWGVLQGSPIVAYSEFEEQGAITFTVDIPCDGVYQLWGLTWDRFAGVSSCGTVANNADNFWISYDGGPEIRWSYGCSSCGMPDAVWGWYLTNEYIEASCTTVPYAMNLTAGTHQIRLRNREAGSFENPATPNVAAVAAIVVTNDPSYDPYVDYTP